MFPVKPRQSHRGSSQFSARHPNEHLSACSQFLGPRTSTFSTYIKEVPMCRASNKPIPGKIVPYLFMLHEALGPDEMARCTSSPLWLYLQSQRMLKTPVESVESRVSTEVQFENVLKPIPDTPCHPSQKADTKQNESYQPCNYYSKSPPHPCTTVPTTPG
jgi:hypothetical protein